APQYEAPGFTGSYGGYRGSGFSYLRNVQRGTSSDVWQADWTLRDDRRLHLRATFVPDRTMNVVLADGEPPLNKAGNPKNLKYVLLRNQADENTPLESTFVTVVEPYRG